MKQKIYTETSFLQRDVKSLYTNIPNHKRIEAVKYVLNFVSQKLIDMKVITRFLFLILTLFKK